MELILLNKHTNSEFNCSNLSSTIHCVTLTKSLNFCETDFIVSKLEFHLAIHRTLLGSNREEKANYKPHQQLLPQGGTFVTSGLAHLYLSPPLLWARHTIYMSRLVKTQNSVKTPPLIYCEKTSLRLTAPIQFWLNGS